MAQETVVDFSVIKQKIIKTDEILRMFMETSNKLKKVQQAYKDIKLKHDQVALNLNRFQLENERCAFNLENVKLNREKLQQENKELKEQIALLEDKYNQQAVQSQLEIKKLQDEFKTAQDLIGSSKPMKKHQCCENENTKKVKGLAEKIKVFKDGEVNLKREIEELAMQNKTLSSSMLSIKQKYSEVTNELELKNEMLRKLKSQKEQVDQNGIIKNNTNNEDSTTINKQNKEIKELKRNICSVQEELKNVGAENEKLKQQLMNQEMILFNSQEKTTTLDFCVQTEMLLQNIQPEFHGLELVQMEEENLREKEIDELKKKISDLMKIKNEMKVIEDENTELKQQLNLFNSKQSVSTTDSCIQTNMENKKRKQSISVQTKNSGKLFELQESPYSENKTLKQSVLNYKMEIVALKDKLKFNNGNVLTQITQTEEFDFDLDCVDNILREMCIPVPTVLSPLSPMQSEIVDINDTDASLSVNVDHTPILSVPTVIPNVIITPPTPTTEDCTLDFDQNEKILIHSPREKKCFPAVDELTIRKSMEKEQSRKLTKLHNKETRTKKNSRRRKYFSPFITNDFIKLRKDYFRLPMSLSKQRSRREIKRRKKVKNEDCILKALQILKQSKINFTISNESTLPKCWSKEGLLNRYPVMISNLITPKYNTVNYLTEKMSCNSPYCTKENNYMMLNKTNNVTELLGFFSIKNEIGFPSTNAEEIFIDSKSSSFSNTDNSVLNSDMQITSEGLLETLAHLVSEKLKVMETMNRKRSPVSDDVESLDPVTENETDIERFSIKQTCDILKRNKILLKKRRQQQRCQSASTTSLDDQEHCNTINEEINYRMANDTPLNLPHHIDEIYKRNMNMFKYRQDHLCQNINKDGSFLRGKEFASVTKESESSCDSFNYLVCPDLISPLSTTSKEYKTSTSKSMVLWAPEHGDTFDSCFNKNSSILTDFADHKNSVHTSNVLCPLQCERKSYPDEIFFPKIASDKLHKISPNSLEKAYINNEQAVSAGTNLFLNNPKNYEEPVKGNILYLRSLLSKEESSLAFKPPYDNLDNLVDKGRKKTPACIDSPTNDESGFDFLIPKIIPLNNSGKGPPETPINGHNITTDFAVPKNIPLDNLGNDDPESPTSDHMATIGYPVPKIIPLDNLQTDHHEFSTNNHNTITDSPVMKNIHLDNLSSEGPESPTNDHSDTMDFPVPKVIRLDNLDSEGPESATNEDNSTIKFSVPKVIPLDNLGNENLKFPIDGHTAIIGSTENILLYHLGSEGPASPTNDDNAATIELPAPKIIPLDNPGSEDPEFPIDGHSAIIDSRKNILLDNIESEGPESPTNDHNATIDFPVPKIIPLENVGSEGPKSSTNNHNDLRVTENIPPDKTGNEGFKSPINHNQDHDYNINNFPFPKNIPKTPDSPVSDYSTVVDFISPKNIPLDNLRSEDMSESFTISSDSSSTSFTNENIDSKQDLPKVVTCHSFNNRKRKQVCTSPVVLRRSKRIMKTKDSVHCFCSNKISKNDSKIIEDQECSKTDKSIDKDAVDSVKQIKRRGRLRKDVEKEQPSNVSNNQEYAVYISEPSTCLGIEKPLESSIKLENADSKVEKLTDIINLDEKSLEKRVIEFDITPTNKTEDVDIIPIFQNDDKTQTEVNVHNVQVETSTVVNDISQWNDKDERKREALASTNAGAIKKRKTMSKLKLNVMKQFREKRKMFQRDIDIANSVNKINICDSKDSNNLNNTSIAIKDTCTNSCSISNINGVENCALKMCDKKQKSSSSKIHIVQNILIPPNSNCPVDLLLTKDQKNHKSASDCDIKLDNLRNSSQTIINLETTAPENEAEAITTNIGTIIPVKKKKIRKKTVNAAEDQSSDILSKIIGEMDKDKPCMNRLSKPVGTLCKSKDILITITDKEWRKGVMLIAESTHNITNEETDLLETGIMCSLEKNLRDIPSKKNQVLISRLLQRSTDGEIPDEIIIEFKRQSPENIAEIILYKVSKDIIDKADVKYYPGPLMTETQRILLTLMVRLENENVENLMDIFLSKAEYFLFKIGCSIRAMAPVVRLYLAICRLRAYVNKMRMFCCNAFLFMGDLAVPLLFIVLTSWTEIFPMESNLKCYPLAKVLVHVVHLKSCRKPGYNLFPLRSLLHQFYGYPKERWNCDEIFEDFFHQYLRNPSSRSSELAVRLLCKMKETKWVYKKVNEFLKPLIYKISAENVNFKATAIILIGKICKEFKPVKELEETYLNDLRRWLIGLTEDEGVPDLVEKSVDLALSMLPKKRQKLKKNKNKKKVLKKGTMLIGTKMNKNVKRRQFKKQ